MTAPSPSQPTAPQQPSLGRPSVDDDVAAAPHVVIIEQRFVVENECHGWRLDRFLQKRIRRLSRSRIQRVIQGSCDVNGRPARPGMRVFAGQQVAFRRPAPSEPEVPRDIRVLLTDPSFYVIEKPAGLPIHPTARYHFSTLTAVLRERFPDERLQVAHRLDRETSGLMLVARDGASASFLKSAFQYRRIRKRYLAIAHGHVDPDLQVVEQPIGPDDSVVRVRMTIRPLDQGGLPSRTEVQVLARSRSYSLLECRPFTGRQHQIRVHLNAIGHPIAGDKLYPDETVFLRWIARANADLAGDPGAGDDDVDDESTAADDPTLTRDRHDAPPAADDDGADMDGSDAQQPDLQLLLPRHALHASGLIFPHPRTGEPVEVESPLPPDLAAFFAQDQER